MPIRAVLRVARHSRLNGKRIICDGEIPGPTGGALDSYEEQPGQIMLQGDHTAVEYRHLTIATAR